MGPASSCSEVFFLSVAAALCLGTTSAVLLADGHPVDERSSIPGRVSPRSGSVTGSAAVVCRPPWLLVGTKCILAEMSISGSWEMGRRFCRGLHKGADLVTFVDANEFAEVLRHTRTINAAKGPISFWVGGTDKAIHDEWLWVTGYPMPVGAPFWGVNEPDRPHEHCALMYHEGSYYLIDAPCSGWDPLHSSPMCEYDPFLHPATG